MQRHFAHEPLAIVLTGSRFARMTEYRRFCRNVREAFAIVDEVIAAKLGRAP